MRSIAASRLHLVIVTGSMCLIVMEASIRNRYREKESQLLENLLARHNKRVKPLGIHNNTFTVMFDAGIVQISDVDEKNQILNGFYYISEQWNDTELAWNQTDFVGIEKLFLQDDMIWTPAIGLVNDIDINLSTKSAVTTYFHVRYTGQVTRSRVINYRSSCEMSLINYPFDKLNCTLTFTVWRYYASQLNLMTTSNVLAQHVMYKNSEFEILSMEVYREVDSKCCSGPTVYVHYHVVFQRRPFFFLLNMLLPCTLVTLVAMFGFCVPPESGERVSLGVTVLLSLTVFLLIVTDEMPPMMDIPLIGIYYFGVTIMVTLSTSLSVFTLSLYHSASYRVEEVPNWMQSLLLRTIAPLLGMKLLITKYEDITYDGSIGAMKNYVRTPIYSQTGNKVGHHEVQAIDTMKMEDEEKQRAHEKTQPENGLAVIIQFLKNHIEKIEREEHHKHMINQWKCVALVVDRALLVLFVFLNLLFTLWIILKAAYYTNE